jgi:hypothetical protein
MVEIFIIDLQMGAHNSTDRPPPEPGSSRTCTVENEKCHSQEGKLT